MVIRIAITLKSPPRNQMLDFAATEYVTPIQFLAESSSEQCKSYSHVPTRPVWSDICSAYAQQHRRQNFFLSVQSHKKYATGGCYA